jgi:hypothetical protein
VGSLSESFQESVDPFFGFGDGEEASYVSGGFLQIAEPCERCHDCGIAHVSGERSRVRSLLIGVSPHALGPEPE